MPDVLSLHHGHRVEKRHPNNIKHKIHNHDYDKLKIEK